MADLIVLGVLLAAVGLLALFFALLHRRTVVLRENIRMVSVAVPSLEEQIERALAEIEETGRSVEPLRSGLNAVVKRTNNAAVELAEARRDLDDLAIKVQALQDAPAPSDDDGALAALRADVEALRANVIDYDAVPTIGPPPHGHVWPPHDRPFAEDATSRSYRCQVPRCQRIQTVATR